MLRFQAAYEYLWTLVDIHRSDFPVTRVDTNCIRYYCLLCCLHGYSLVVRMTNPGQSIAIFASTLSCRHVYRQYTRDIQQWIRVCVAVAYGCPRMLHVSHLCSTLCHIFDMVCNVGTITYARVHITVYCYMLSHNDSTYQCVVFETNTARPNSHVIANYVQLFFSD